MTEIVRLKMIERQLEAKVERLKTECMESNSVAESNEKAVDVQTTLRELTKIKSEIAKLESR